MHPCLCCDSYEPLLVSHRSASVCCQDTSPVSAITVFVLLRALGQWNGAVAVATSTARGRQHPVRPSACLLCRWHTSQPHARRAGQPAVWQQNRAADHRSSDSLRLCHHQGHLSSHRSGLSQAAAQQRSRSLLALLLLRRQVGLGGRGGLGLGGGRLAAVQVLVHLARALPDEIQMARRVSNTSTHRRHQGIAPHAPEAPRQLKKYRPAREIPLRQKV